MKFFLSLLASLTGVAVISYSMTSYANTPTKTVTTTNATQTHHNASSQTTPQPQLINQIVAIVNNEAITANELTKAVAFAQLQATQMHLTMPDMLSFKRQVLQQLITQTIALQLTKLNHIDVTDAELNAAMKDIATRNNISVAALQQQVTDQGMDFQLYQQEIKNHLLITKLEQKTIAASIMVTQSEINNYLAQLAQETDPNILYNIDHILIAPNGDPTPQNIAKAKQKANQVLTEIQQGLDFSAAAIKYSQADDALKGGKLGWQTINEIPTIFIKPVQSMKLGAVYGPFQTNSGFHIIKLIGKKKPPATQHFITEYHIKQIMIATSPVQSELQAKTTAQQLYAEIVNGGKSFTTVAQASSQDNNSNKQGGDLGWVQLSQLPPKIAAAIPDLKEKTTSNPIADAQGNWYLIQALGKKQVNDTHQYQEMQARITIFNKKAAQALMTWQLQIRGASYIKIVDPTLDESNTSTSQQ